VKRRRVGGKNKVKVAPSNSKHVFACEVMSLNEMSSRAFDISLESGGVFSGFVVKDDEGHLMAYTNSCPHTGAPLNWTPDQFLTKSGRYIQCSVHGAMFKIDDGECFSGPCAGKFLTPLKMSVVDGDLFIALP
jgi:nitrite reductase/ring-hydroxylating ferredoxin subunit